MKIADIEFTTPALDETRAFYVGALGMTEMQVEGGFRFAFPGADTGLVFRSGERVSARPGAQGVYWKIGLTVRDLDHAVAGLGRLGVDVSAPRQFRDIGYLCHLADPSGLSIELLQQGFEGRAEPAGAGHPVGGQGTLAHLTFRTRDIAASDALFIDELGLTRVSRQPVDDLDFELHFYSGVEETPPEPDIAAVGNREWLWRRPHAMIEVQHLKSAEGPLVPALGSGFESVAFDDGRRFSAACLADFS